MLLSSWMSCPCWLLISKTICVLMSIGQDFLCHNVQMHSVHFYMNKVPRMQSDCWQWQRERYPMLTLLPLHSYSPLKSPRCWRKWAVVSIMKRLDFTKIVRRILAAAYDEGWNEYSALLWSWSILVALRLNATWSLTNGQSLLWMHQGSLQWNTNMHTA